MTGSGVLPTSGYVLQRVYAPRQKYEALPPSDNYAAQLDTSLTLGWDWQVAGEDTFEVVITVSYAPSQERSESIEVAVVGVFRLEGETQSVDFLNFVQIHAPSILMPFARSIVASLTGNGFLGALYMPPLNVKSIMERMDGSITTGAKQLHDNPAILRFGTAPQIADVSGA